MEVWVGCEVKIRLRKDAGEFILVAVEGDSGSLNNFGEGDVVVG